MGRAGSQVTWNGKSDEVELFGGRVVTVADSGGVRWGWQITGTVTAVRAGKQRGILRQLRDVEIECDQLARVMPNQ